MLAYRNVVDAYRQASPLEAKKQVVGIIQDQKGFRNIPDKSVFG